MIIFFTTLVVGLFAVFCSRKAVSVTAVCVVSLFNIGVTKLHQVEYFSLGEAVSTKKPLICNGYSVKSYDIHYNTYKMVVMDKELSVFDCRENKVK